MYPVYTNQNGDLLTDKAHTAAAIRGSEFFMISEASQSSDAKAFIKANYIPMPSGATFAAMPGRTSFVYDKNNKLIQGKGTAVSVLLPQGFSRTLLPAVGLNDGSGPEVLPLLGYTACAMGNDGKVYVAARQTDEHKDWHPRNYNTGDLPQRIAKVKKQLKDNRIVSQLAHCSLNYGCFTAQNLFYRRREAGLPVSRSCNAACVGCISLQESEACPSAQGRLKFSPTVKEIAEIAAFHLGGKYKNNIISFGQGCEGEPSTEAVKIAKAIPIVRRYTKQGTINMNTNAGNTDNIKTIVDAGINSLRVSIFSAVSQHYNAYYRPRNYCLKDVEASIKYAVDNGVFVSLNLLAFPGFTDREDETEALCHLIKKTGLQKVQIRNLNIDTDFFYKECGFKPEPSRGVDYMIKAFESAGAEIGNYSRHVEKPRV